MHNDLAEVRVRLEERRADPNQIVRVLGFERHAWPHAGMDEQIIAEGDGELECLEEIAMGLRQRGKEGSPPRVRRRPFADELFEIHSIRAERCVSPVGEPLAEKRGIFEEIEHDRLVIALEEVRVESLRQRTEQHVDHAAAVMAAIDVVAEKNQGSPFCFFALRRIGRDLVEQQSEQVRPAVNVADGIDELALRH